MLRVPGRDVTLGGREVREARRELLAPHIHLVVPPAGLKPTASSFRPVRLASGAFRATSLCRKGIEPLIFLPARSDEQSPDEVGIENAVGHDGRP